MYKYDGYKEEFSSMLGSKKYDIEEDKLIKTFTEDIRKKYSVSLKVKDIIELTGYSQATVYRMLECGEIPGAKKIRGWRVPRDVFLAWWYMDSSDSDELY